jgi:hypothetical protein
MFSMINSPDLYGSISGEAVAPQKKPEKKVDDDDMQMQHMVAQALDAIIRKCNAHETLLKKIEERLSSDKDKQPPPLDINKLLQQYAPFFAIALMILVLFMCMRKGGQPMPYIVQSPQHGVPFKLPTTFM